MIRKHTMYQIRCDRCGEYLDWGDGYLCFESRNEAKEAMQEAGEVRGKEWICGDCVYRENQSKES